MDKIVLNEFFVAQSKLDENIANNHNVSYATTREKRIMALIVEIGELANVTRCFKYWSNKGMENKDIVLDEYADGLHFFLSLGVDLSTEKMEYQTFADCLDLTSQFHKVYHLIDVFHENQTLTNYENAFQSFFNLLPLLGYTWEELSEAYYKKLGVNYKRQETNY